MNWARLHSRIEPAGVEFTNGCRKAMDPDELGLWLHDFLDIAWRGFLSRARPHARTGHITPMGPIFSPSANFFCSSLNDA
jgi:hypothetical protein